VNIRPLENLFTFHDFWATCACPEKTELPWNFFKPAGTADLPPCTPMSVDIISSFQVRLATIRVVKLWNTGDDDLLVLRNSCEFIWITMERWSFPIRSKAFHGTFTCFLFRNNKLNDDSKIEKNVTIIERKDSEQKSWYLRLNLESNWLREFPVQILINTTNSISFVYKKSYAKGFLLGTTHLNKTKDYLRNGWICFLSSAKHFHLLKQVDLSRSNTLNNCKLANKLSIHIHITMVFEDV